MITIDKFGADPEVFLKDKNGHAVSAEGLFGGTKEHPRQMEGLPEGFMVQEDNVAAEYNIPPTDSPQEFSHFCALGLNYIKARARDLGLRVGIAPTMVFTKKQLSTIHAQTLGCDPDLDLWRLKYNPTPRPPETFRTAAGHVHISWKNPTEEQRISFGRTLDLYLGVPSILVTKPSLRRTLYGRAGAVRMKPYGIEYRTLDNFWLTKKIWREHIVRACYEAADRLNREGDFFMEEVESFKEDIGEAINNHNVNTAKYLIDEFELPRFSHVD